MAKKNRLYRYDSHIGGTGDVPPEEQPYPDKKIPTDTIGRLRYRIEEICEEGILSESTGNGYLFRFMDQKEADKALSALKKIGVVQSSLNKNILRVWYGNAQNTDMQ